MTADSTPITTLIFDIDDTIYDVGTGFSEHRVGPIVHKYMVDYLKVPTLEQAKAIRDEYFVRYHSTSKALLVAQQEGRFPADAPIFEASHLANYWVENLDYTMLGPPKTELYNKLKECPLTLVAFSNGPRAYCKRVLETLGLFDLFGEERLYAVDDVLPYCKPEAEAFEKIFSKIGHPSPESCVMFEDSMKNIHQAKKLGIKTVLLTGKSEEGRLLLGDKPEVSDEAVDCSLALIEDLPKVLPGLWQSPAVLDPQPL
eukprot:Nitzschia sp. Nitz4//scaffold88_size82704//56536//57306//NITZ4_005300-RA/size82704-processed-gene-0.55-mRNA-1//1//CDS//3329559518//7885//frame0